MSSKYGGIYCTICKISLWKGRLSKLSNEINIVSNLQIIMSTIDQHIEKDRQVLDDPTISSQNRRHTSEELQALEAYKEHHPEDSHDPTPLELYCDSHPDALECRFYLD
jgi:hypothetical protein